MPFLARPNAHADPLCIVVARPSKLAVLALRFHRRLGVEKRNSKSSGSRSGYLSCRASFPINLGTAHPARRLDSSWGLRILSSCRRLRHVHHTPTVIVESENEAYRALLLQGRKEFGKQECVIFPEIRASTIRRSGESAAVIPATSSTWTRCPGASLTNNKPGTPGCDKVRKTLLAWRLPP